MFVERVTSVLELLGMVLLSAAVTLGVYTRWGSVVALGVAGLLAFGWSYVLGVVHREPAPAEEAS